jgi:hypothetical protein
MDNLEELMKAFINAGRKLDRIMEAHVYAEIQGSL